MDPRVLRYSSASGEGGDRRRLYGTSSWHCRESACPANHSSTPSSYGRTHETDPAGHTRRSFYPPGRRETDASSAGGHLCFERIPNASHPHAGSDGCPAFWTSGCSDCCSTDHSCFECVPDTSHRHAASCPKSCSCCYSPSGYGKARHR